MKKRKARRLQLPIEIYTPIKGGFGYQIPPDKEWVHMYFDQKSCPHLAENFYLEFKKRHWQTITGKLIRNWKTLATDWIFEYHQEVKLKLKKSRFM
jgi:hypothetical protein